MNNYDCVIVGGGLVGLATGFAYLEKNPGARFALIEKESQVGIHQSSRNSGVLHAGLYYTPGSMRARLCATGKAAMEEFCRTHGVAYETCGKLIVATEAKQIPGLDRLLDRAQKNGIPVRRIGPEEAREFEPHVNAVGALHVPSSGICDYPAVCLKLADLIREKGGDILVNHELKSVRVNESSVTLQTYSGEIHTAYMVNCAGLYADRVASMAGVEPEAQIVPFRGEFFDVKPDRWYLVKNLIYPVADPDFPFLGVHMTRYIHGGIHAGPNAVLAYAREGYGKWDVHPGELFESLTYPGFVRMAWKNMGEGWKEMRRSWSKKLFTQSVQRLIPEIKEEDL